MNLLNTKAIAKTVVLSADRRVLLLRRSNDDPKGPGLWDLPGGTVEAGEQLEEAAYRELGEEAGLVFERGQMQLIYTKTGMFERGNRCWLFFVAECNDIENVVLSTEHQSFEWVPLHEAQHREYFQTQQEVLQYLAQNMSN